MANRRSLLTVRQSILNVEYRYREGSSFNCRLMFSIPLVRENRYIFVPLSKHGVLQFLQLLPRSGNPCYLKSAISHQNVTNKALFRGLTHIRNFLRVFHSPPPLPPSPPSHEIQTGFQLLFGNLDRRVWMKRDLFETTRDEIICRDFFYFFRSPISSLGSRKILKQKGQRQQRLRLKVSPSFLSPRVKMYALLAGKDLKALDYPTRRGPRLGTLFFIVVERHLRHARERV